MIAEILNPGTMAKFQEVQFERETNTAGLVTMRTTEDDQSQIEGAIADMLACLRLRLPAIWPHKFGSWRVNSILAALRDAHACRFPRGSGTAL